MAQITTLDVLKQRQTVKDKEAPDLVTATAASHAAHLVEGADHPLDLSPRPLRQLSPVDAGICECCGDAEFTVRDKKSGRTSPMCRCCINAVRRQSLCHTQYGDREICYRCEITYDSLGIINAANHHTWPVEDTEYTRIVDGISVTRTRPGLLALIAAGKIDLTDDVVTIL